MLLKTAVPGLLPSLFLLATANAYTLDSIGDRLQDDTLVYVDATGSKALTDMESSIEWGDGCVVAVYFNDLQRMAQKGEAHGWSTDLDDEADPWYAHNGMTPWCREGGPDTKTSYPGPDVVYRAGEESKSGWMVVEVEDRASAEGKSLISPKQFRVEATGDIDAFRTIAEVIAAYNHRADGIINPYTVGKGDELFALRYKDARDGSISLANDLPRDA